MNTSRTTNRAVTGRDYAAIKAALGTLCIVAAVACAVGATMSASLFGGLAAITLSAGATFAALIELADGERTRGWRLGVWAALAPGWITVAAILFNAPLGHVDELRVLVSALLAVSAALRAWRWQVRPNGAAPGITLTLGFALLALAAAWSGAWTHVGVAATVVFSCALELGGSGSLWYADALMSRRLQARAGEGATAASAPAVAMQSA